MDRPYGSVELRQESNAVEDEVEALNFVRARRFGRVVSDQMLRQRVLIVSDDLDKTKVDGPERSEEENKMMGKKSTSLSGLLHERL